MGGFSFPGLAELLKLRQDPTLGALLRGENPSGFAGMTAPTSPFIAPDPRTLPGYQPPAGPASAAEYASQAGATIGPTSSDIKGAPNVDPRTWSPEMALPGGGRLFTAGVDAQLARTPPEARQGILDMMARTANYQTSPAYAATLASPLPGGGFTDYSRKAAAQGAPGFTQPNFAGAVPGGGGSAMGAQPAPAGGGGISDEALGRLLAGAGAFGAAFPQQQTQVDPIVQTLQLIAQLLAQRQQMQQK